MYINIMYKLLHDEANDEQNDPLESTRKDAERMDEIQLSSYQLLLEKVLLQLLLHKTF